MSEIKILCRYCELKNKCCRRNQKMKYEDAGFTSYCTLAVPRKRNHEDVEKSKKWQEDGRKNAARR